MNVLAELMKLLNLNAVTAEAVQYEMDCSGIDYSQCTVREFNSKARECYDVWMAVRADMEAA